MKLSKIYLALTLLASPSAFADINFAQYCTPSANDCSSQLQQAILDANANVEKIVIPSGVYKMIDFNPSANGYNFSTIDLQGAGKQQIGGTTILTNRFWAKNVGYVSINGIRFEAINKTDGSAYYSDSALLSFTNAHHFNFSNNAIDGAPEGLLSLAQSSGVTINNNTLHNSGLARNRRSNGVPVGGAISMMNITNGDISYNDIENIWQIGIFAFTGYGGSTSGLTISHNRVVNVEDNGIRTTSENPVNDLGDGISNITIEKNTIEQVNIDGIRINGTNMTVSNNTINSSIATNGIKAHSLRSSVISNNNIYNTSNGITLHTKLGNSQIDNVQVANNYIKNVANGVTATADSNLNYTNIVVSSNEIYDFDQHGVVFYGYASNLSNGSIHSNTMNNSNKGKQFNSWAVRVDHQSNLYFGNNYIYGQSYASSPHVNLINVKDGVIETSTIISPNTAHATTGGFVLDANTTSIEFRNNNFINISTGYCDLGNGNTADVTDRCL